MKLPWAHRPLIFLVIVGLFITTVGSACILSNPTPAVWALTPTALALQASQTAYVATQSASFKPQIPYTPTPTITLPTPTTPAQGLNQSGPWLVYPTDDGEALAIFNSDGNGSLHVAIPTLLDANDLKNGLSPSGGILAFRTGSTSKPEDTALYFLHLPDGKLEQVTSLVAESVAASASQNKDSRALNALAGVIQSGTLAWSPDGRYLAFIGALDRNSADLYLYDTSVNKISRLNFGSNSLATPFWSKDSQWVTVQEVSSFTGSNGWALGSVIRFNAKTGLYEGIYTPSDKSNREVFVNWASSNAFLAYSQNQNGDFSLRLIDLTSLKVTKLFTGYFKELSYDPSSKIIAFTVASTSTTSSTYQTGLYMMTPNDITPHQVQAGSYSALEWSAEGNEFIVKGIQGVLSVTTDGQATLLANEDQALPSPSGKWLAYWGNGSSSFSAGIWFARSVGNVSQQISSETVQKVIWKPDSNGIFFLSGNSLYLSTLPALTPSLLDSNVYPGFVPMLVWVSAAK